jgi:hypothetical protein
MFVIQFCWGKSVCPRGCAAFCSLGRIGEFCVVHGAHLFVLSIDAQAGLEVVVVVAVVARNDTKFSTCLFVVVVVYSVCFFLFFPWVGVGLSRRLC